MNSFNIFQLLFIIIILFFYHIAEYLLQLKINPELTDKDSFLITKEYLFAYSIAIIEYIIEATFFPNKVSWSSPMVYVGLLMIIIGLVIRFAAIIHAQKSFTHRVQTRKRKAHKLVTDGIYKYIRHPGYFGFFVFAVGTEVFFENPVSVVIFIIVLWRFFSNRIYNEEKYLVDFFGKDYEDYRRRTPTLIPFIK